MLVALLVAALPHRGAARVRDDCTTGVYGVVRAEATGDSIPGARVESPDARVAASADGTGRYALCLAQAGHHLVRFGALGYEARLVDVQVRPGARLRLDVALGAAPARLGPVRIVASTRPADTAAGALATSAMPAGSAWRATGDEIRDAAVADAPDLLRLLTTVPEARMSPEATSGLHLRGGAGDQSRYLVDGAPVYSPVHPGALASALGPDIVAGATLYDAVPPARLGGALSGVLDVDTPSLARAPSSVAGDFDPTALGGTAHVSLLPGHAALLVSGRHTYRGIERGDPRRATAPNAWSDRFGKLALHAGANDVALSWFAADNVVRLPSQAPTGDARDRFAWTTSTIAARWRRPLGTRAMLDVHGWHAGLSTGAAWRSDSALLDVRGALRDDGLSAAVALPGPGGVTVGTEVRRLDTRYDAGPTTRLAASPTIAATFVDSHWSPWPRWALDVGVRESFGRALSPLVEPRLALRVAPTTGLALSVGYARTHQFSQSARNEESLLATVVGADPALAFDGRRVPVAVADQLSAAAAIALPWRTRLQLDAYARRLGGLLLVAPTTSEPFAVRPFALGGGEAWGTSASILHRDGRLSLQGSYAVGQTVLRADGLRYHPAFAPDQSALVAAGYRIARHTSLRAALWTASGRATTMIGDDIAWENRDGILGDRELSGTPVHTLGALDAEHLPLYLRIDLGVRHSVPVRAPRGTLTLFASLDNALARENATALVLAGARDRTRPIPMVPFSVVAGLSWRY